MNAILSTVTDENVSYNTIAEALDEQGYNVMNKDSWNPSYKKYDAYWLQEKNTIVLVEGDQIAYPENLKGALADYEATPVKGSSYFVQSTANTSAGVVTDIKAAINNGSSITITEEVDLSDVKAIQVPEDVEITVDLGGNTLTTDERNPGVDHQYGFQVSGDLTIKNAVVSARGVEVYDGGTLTLNDATIDAVDSNGGAAVYVWKGGKAIINGGTYTNSAVVTEELEGATAVISYGDLTINGGTFESKAGVYAVIVKAGKATINGATITGARGGIAVEGATVTITNCTVKNNSDKAYALYVGVGTVTVSGNTFTNTNGGLTVYKKDGATINGTY
jgi:hypothetical protein